MEPFDTLADELLQLPNRHPPAQRPSDAMKGEMAVLRALFETDKPQNAGVLGKELTISSSRMAAILNSLERKGHLIRQTDPKDHRRVLVQLTETGSAFCRQRYQEHLGHLSAALAKLGETDAREFLRLSYEITKALSCQKPSPPSSPHP